MTTDETELQEQQTEAQEAEVQPESFTREDAEAEWARRAEQMEAQYEQRFQELASQIQQPKPKADEVDLNQLAFDNPTEFARVIEERAYNRAMEQVAPHINNVSRVVIEGEVFKGLPAEAHESAKNVLKELNPQILANLNAEGVAFVQDRAIAAAYRAGKLAPRMPQRGAPANNGQTEQLIGVTEDHIRGWELMTGQTATPEIKRQKGWIK